jgi:hypothetical protein
MKYGNEVQNVSLKLINYLEPGKIMKARTIKIFINDRWLTMDQHSNDLETPIMRMILKEWVEIRKQPFSTKEIDYINLIKKIIYKHFNKKIEESIRKKIKMEFNTKYLNDMCFELCWREDKNKLKMECIDDKIWYSEKSKENVLFLLKVRNILVRGDMGIHISVVSMKNHLSNYFREIYEKTTEYKLKNIYK